MKKFLVYFLFVIFVNAAELDILDKNKKELRELEKQRIQSSYESLKNSWITPWSIGSSINKTLSSNDDITTSKKLSIGFSQNIYKFGGIELSIKYADDKNIYDNISWENDNYQLIENIYETALAISKLKLQIEQSKYALENKEIEVILKKIQYENGDLDITDLNNAIIAKNDQSKQNINLINSLKDKELELAKYTPFKYDEIDIIDFTLIPKDEYLSGNIELNLQKAKTQMLQTEYKKTSSDYFPSVALSGEYGYSSTFSSNGDYGSVGLSFSVPLDFNKNSTIQEAKVSYLKEKVEIEYLKNELLQNYNQIITQIDTYQKYNDLISEDIKLYNELIDVSTISSQAGQTSLYDLDILKNTKTINEYELKINQTNIKLEFASLYFKTKGKIR